MMKRETKSKALIAAFLVLIALIVNLIGWGLYTTVMQYFWPDGPERIINPDFWMFFAGALLVKMLFSSIRRA